MHMVARSGALVRSGGVARSCTTARSAGVERSGALARSWPLRSAAVARSSGVDRSPAPPSSPPPPPTPGSDRSGPDDGLSGVAQPAATNIAAANHVENFTFYSPATRRTLPRTGPAERPHLEEPGLEEQPPHRHYPSAVR